MHGSRGVRGPLLIRFLVRPRRGRSGGHCAFRPFFVVLFQALREPNTLPVKLIDMAMMGEPIQQGRRQGSLSEDFGPVSRGRSTRSWGQVTPSQNENPNIPLGLVLGGKVSCSGTLVLINPLLPYPYKGG